MKLNDKILNLRKQRGMSQEELAGKLNVSRQAVSRWEIGSAQPDASNIFQLSRLFDVSADYLLDNEQGTPSPHPAERRTSRKAPMVIGLGTAAVGVLGNLAIYIFSRVVKVPVPFIQYNENGQKWYHWSYDHTGYSYKYFVQDRNLEALTVILWILTAAGLLIAFANREKFRAAAVRLRERLTRRSAAGNRR